MNGARRRSLEGANLRPAFPFFVGSEHSGATHLRRMFDAHPVMAVPDMSPFILTMARRRRAYESAEGIRVEPFLADLYRHADLAVGWGLPIDELRRRLMEAVPKDFPAAIRRVMEIRARGMGKTRFAIGAPIYVLHLALLSRLFPEAVFVHMIRDGRDVARSLRDDDPSNQTTEGAALVWQRQVRRGRKAGRTLGVARYREVRYEDLMERPRRVGEALCDFIGLSFDDAILAHLERVDDRPSDAIPASDLERFEVLAGGLLSELGYRPTFAEPGAGARAAARRGAFVARARYAAESLRRRDPERSSSPTSLSR